MDISREKATGSGDASIRLRYNRQLQSGGQTHTIDAEVALPVGASQELREQMIRDLELGVEQLARQIQQRNTRPTENPRSQTPTANRAVSPTPSASRPASSAYAQGETEQRQAPRATSSGNRTPVEESMPDNPAGSNEGNPIKLPVFISAIKKHLDLSPQEAMRLLHVETLDGLNFRKVYNDLQQIVGQRNADKPGTHPPTRNQQTDTDNDASRQTRRTAPLPAIHPSENQAPAPDRNTQTQAPVALKTVARETATDEPEKSRHREPETVADFAGSPKAPLPIQFGVTREIIAPSYKFEEEDEELEEEDEDEDEDFDLPGEKPHGQLSAQQMLNNLKEIRGNTPANAERLIALNNVIGEQISEKQLQKLLQMAWGITTRKKLKLTQIEKLISWAKEDFFVEEVEAILALIAEEED
jgi:hypothetical protein